MLGWRFFLGFLKSLEPQNLPINFSWWHKIRQSMEFEALNCVRLYWVHRRLRNRSYLAKKGMLGMEMHFSYLSC